MTLLKKRSAFKVQAMAEFRALVDPLLENEKVRMLDTFMQHYKYTRLRHSLDVAYYSFCLAKLLGWDADSTARAGLLHDLFYYDRRHEQYNGINVIRKHPLIAVENAKEVCELNALEVDIIKKHMWLLTFAPPSYKEGYIVTFVDKYCAGREFIVSLFLRRKVRAVYS